MVFPVQKNDPNNMFIPSNLGFRDSIRAISVVVGIVVVAIFCFRRSSWCYCSCCCLYYCFCCFRCWYCCFCCYCGGGGYCCCFYVSFVVIVSVVYVLSLLLLLLLLFMLLLFLLLISFILLLFLVLLVPMLSLLLFLSPLELFSVPFSALDGSLQFMLVLRVVRLRVRVDLRELGGTMRSATAKSPVGFYLTKIWSARCCTKAPSFTKGDTLISTPITNFQ